MTPGERRFGRRALLVGTAGAASAGVAYEVIRLDGETEPTVSPGGPVDTGHVDQSGQTVDLTVRWRHLERRVEDPDLLAGWQFDEGAGYAFVDVSGHQHTLHVTGLDWNTTDSGLASAIHRRGSRGGAVHLNRTRWLAAAPVADLVPRAGLTVSCRLRADVMPLSEAALVAFGTSYAITLSATGALTLTVEDRAGSQRMVRTSARAVTPGEWIQISATAAPRTGTLRLYVDGELVSHVQGRPFALRSKIASLVVGGQLDGDVDELAIHRVPLSAAEVQRLHVLGLPKVFTQTSESIDAERSVFTHFKGSDPIPHPVTEPTRLTHRFAASTRTEQGVPPLVTPQAMTFVPGAFGAAWSATSERLTYPSPLSGDSGTFEAWYRTTQDPRDPGRQRRKEIFAAAGPSASLVLFTEAGRWQVEVRRRGGGTDTLAGPSHPFLSGILEHVAVSWGEQAGGRHGVALYVNGVPAGLLPTLAGETSYSRPIGLGGRPGAPTYALVDDVRICDTALPWREICPRGHATTEAAGLDLRDRFDRPPGAAPLLWRPGSPQSKWSHRRKAWERPAAVGADPDSLRALFQGEPTGLHAIFHPDAFGYASSIEAGVAFPAAVDGWAGVFVQAPQPHGAFSGLTFMLNPHQGRLRLARFESGRATVSKVLDHDFPVTEHATYELTLTCSGDGLVRGFVDGTNVISTRVGAGWPDRGYAGLLTDGSQAFFSDLHFCALTPPSPSSRVVRSKVIRYGEGAAVGEFGLVPFRWHKRRGLLPWQYTFKDPEPAGNIAGAATAVPVRPIGAATWRSEDSANSDLITVAGQVLFMMRGNPRIDNRASVARIGVLHIGVPAFDGIHFSDPNAGTARVDGGTVLVSGGPRSSHQPVAPGRRPMSVAAGCCSSAASRRCPNPTRCAMAGSSSPASTWRREAGSTSFRSICPGPFPNL